MPTSSMMISVLTAGRNIRKQLQNFAWNMAQVLVIGSIVRPVFLALPSHFLCTPCLLQRMLLLMAPLWYANSLTHCLHSTLFPSLSLANQCHTPTQLTKGSATWSSHAVHTHISNWFYGQSEMLLVLLHLVDTSDCSWYLQLAIFASCLYAASWFALCSNGYVTSHPTCFSRGEQWQPVVNTKAHTPSPLSTNIIWKHQYMAMTVV